jgi:hypothetical protein
MDRIGVVNYNGSVAAGLAVKALPSIWIVLGKTSAWVNEASPDSPLPGNNVIVEPFVAIKPIILSMSSIVTLDTYNTLGSASKASVIVGDVPVYLQLVADVDAYTFTARYLYIQALFDPVVAQMTSATAWRTYYGVSGLIPTAGNENALWLPAANVESFGRIFYENSGIAQQGTNMMDIPILLEFS